MTYKEIMNFPIESNEYNQKLCDLYADTFTKDIVNSIETYNSTTTPTNRIVNPQLITIDHDFMDSKYRIIHFGDETNGWGGEDPEREGIFNPNLIPGFLMKLYEHHKKFHGHDSNWNYCDRIKKQFPNVSILHMNILLMGYPYGCTGGYAEMNYKINKITKGILRIASPHLCIFHTGGQHQFKEYDNHIRKMIGDFDTNDNDNLRDENKKLLASKIKFRNSEYNFKAIRANHINARLRKEKWGKVNRYIEQEIESLLSE